MYIYIFPAFKNFIVRYSEQELTCLQ